MGMNPNSGQPGAGPGPAACSQPAITIGLAIAGAVDAVSKAVSGKSPAPNGKPK